ncbi:hypothetical protein [uncultured Maribacter sp.]|uniref:hypothetical protein n=1 Tax=uncultured Maribacter sp. TaxID=431308 RepID=UPI0026335058|nr:hypothetical protein [uncultured Maribacter sp.]
MSIKLDRLKFFLQGEVSTAQIFSEGRNSQRYSPFNSLDYILENRLNEKSVELSILLQEVAQEEFKKQNPSPEDPDFSKYVRYSYTNMEYKEVFVGNKWILVPIDTCVDFRSTTIGNVRGFIVNINYGKDFATFSSTERLRTFNQSQCTGEQLKVEQQKNPYSVRDEQFNWQRAGQKAYGKIEKHVTTLDDVGYMYGRLPKEFKRTYAYKISKAAKKVGKPAKAGKIFQGGEKLARKAKVLGPIGNVLTTGNIFYEVVSNTWDAHTVVDGVLLVVAIGATTFGAPMVLTGIAIYGILDYAFDISETIDRHFGRDSGLWDEKPISSFPLDNKPLLKL